MACVKVLMQNKIRTRFCYAVFNPSPQQKFLPLQRTLNMSIAQGKSKRPMCPSCSKPARTCLCSRILTPGIENSVSVTILQHALESKHPLNSTRIARLGLRNLNVASVSDVNFEARIIIRLMEPDSKSGLVRNCSDSLIFRQGWEIGGAQKPMDENISASDSRRESKPESFSFFGCAGKCCSKIDTGTVKSSLLRTEVVNHVVNSKLSINDCVEMNDKAETDKLHSNFECNRDAHEDNGKSAITAIIGKHGVISSLSHIWMPLTQPQKPTFSNIFACPEACEALSRGFLVKKLQRRQFGRSVNLKDDEECEYELEVPSGSVLLFPSDKAVDINDLDAIGLEVKNLIVLDGTWAKARRVYSENPWLNILPHVKLEVKKMSLYSEVRREPKAGYLSTIESIVHALKAVGENHESLDNLLDAFESMVGDQRRFKEERLTKRSPI